MEQSERNRLHTRVMPHNENAKETTGERAFAPQQFVCTGIQVISF